MELQQLPHLTEQQCAALQEVTAKFRFHCNDYYLSLIDWSDPNDPIRRIIVPDLQELDRWGRLDPSDEQAYTVIPGVEHKYDSTVLVLVSNECAGVCRYCFRKRVFQRPHEEYLTDFDSFFGYVKAHPQITNVLLTGGDPLMLATEHLEMIIARLREIDHVQIIRIGTKMPVFDPIRILEDDGLIETIDRYSTARKRIYVMTHFMHARELTDVALEAVDRLHRAGAVVNNQCPLIRGVNDDPTVLAELLSSLSYAGVIPYYVFQCRPALGNKAYTVPIEEAYGIVEEARGRISGLAKRIRYVMSHATGKLEIAALTDSQIVFKYHRVAEDCDTARVLTFPRNPHACWLEDYGEPMGDYPLAKRT